MATPVLRKVSKKSEFILAEELLEDSRIKKARILAKGKKKETSLTEKQEKLAVIMAADPTKPFSVMKVEAGFDKKFPNNLVKKQIAGKFGTTLAECGVFECDVGKAIAEGLSANRYVLVRTNERDETGKILKETVQMAAIPDHKTRLGYVKVAIDLGGYFAAKKLDVTHSADEKTAKVMAILEKIDPAKLEQSINQDREDGVEADFEVLEEAAVG